MKESNPRHYTGTAFKAALHPVRHPPVLPVDRTGSGLHWADLCAVSTLLCVSTALPLDFPTDATGWALFSRLNDASGSFRPLHGCPGHDSRFPAHLRVAGVIARLSSLVTPISRLSRNRPVPMRLKSPVFPGCQCALNHVSGRHVPLFTPHGRGQDRMLDSACYLSRYRASKVKLLIGCGGRCYPAGLMCFSVRSTWLYPA